MAKEIDLINRDPHDMNNYIQVEFDDVLGEPNGAHSADCIWQNSSKCFTCGKNLCYQLLTYLCGLCVALGWGCTFACVAFSSIWCWTPLLRILSILLHPAKKIISIMLGTFYGPCIETMGLIFSRIHVVNSTGPAPKALDGIDGDDNQKGKVKNFA